MQITLNQEEINEAVEIYARSQINIAPNQSLEIDFVAGRGANGLSATLDIRTNKGVAAASKPVHRGNTPTVVETESAAEKPVAEVADKPADKPVDAKSLFKAKAPEPTKDEPSSNAEITPTKSVFAKTATGS